MSKKAKAPSKAKRLARKRAIKIYHDPRQLYGGQDNI